MEPSGLSEASTKGLGRLWEGQVIPVVGFVLATSLALLVSARGVRLSQLLALGFACYIVSRALTWIRNYQVNQERDQLATLILIPTA